MIRKAHFFSSESLWGDGQKWWLFIVGLLCGYFFILWHYGLNLPLWDEYDAVLGDRGLLPVIQATDWSQFFHYLFLQQNEHRIMTTRVVEWMQYSFNGEINFRALIIIGNMFRVAILFLCFSTAKNRNKWFLFLLMFFVLQLSDWDSTFMGISALSVYMVIFFVFLSFLLLQLSCADQKKWRSLVLFLAACFTSFLAAFSNGNGMLVFIPGLLMLFWNKRYNYLLIYSLVAVFCIGGYFQGFNNNQYAHTFNPIKLSIYSLFFLGNILPGIFAFLIGLFGIGVFGFLFWLNIKQNTIKNNVIFYCIFFIVLSALAAGFDRAAYGVTQALSSRYTIYSILFFALLLIWYRNQGKEIKMVLVVLMSILATSQTTVGLYKQKFERILPLKNNISAAGKSQIIFNYPDQKRALEILKDASRAGIYTMPNLNYESLATI